MILTDFLLLGIAVLSVFGWWRAMRHWQRAMEREALLLKIVRKCIAHLPTLTEDLADMDASETRH